jgi:hypothetical protein
MRSQGRSDEVSEALIESGSVKGTASEPVLSAAEGCHKPPVCNAALAAEGIFRD